MSAPPQQLRADVLARLLLIQSTAAHLDQDQTIVELACRGFEMVPGVRRVSYRARETSPPGPPESCQSHALKYGDWIHGQVDVELTSADAYAPYAPHVQNVLHVLGLMLEERRQRRRAEEYREHLEQRVEARTAQLSREIAERALAEERARFAADRAEGYLAVSEALIIECDLEGRIELVNSRVSQILGSTEPELLGSSWFETVFGPRERSRVRSVIEQLRRAAPGELLRCDTSISVRSGGLRHIAWNLVLRKTSGHTTGFIASGIDITERKLIEEKLAEEKEQLDVTLRSIGDGVITTDTRGVIQGMNPVAEELTGWRLEEALGQPLSQVLVTVAAASNLPCEEVLTRALSKERVVEVSTQLELIDRGGRHRSLAETAAPLRDNAGRVMGAVFALRDVTEKLRLAEQAQRAERLDAIGVLAGGIAHDFNNLLAGIFGYLCLARELATDREAQVAALDDALSVFERARDLTQQLLTFSKGGAPVRDAVDLGRLLSDCARFALSGSNVALDLQLSEELPSVPVDPNQIWRVVDNLIRNAVQAMPEGGTVTIRGVPIALPSQNRYQLAAGDYVSVTISDQGPGIPPEHLKRIFEPFFTTKQQGTGLGLATAYSVVRRHEGRLEVESTQGKGTSFTIILPTAGQLSTVRQCPVSPTEHLGAGRALLLDDEPYLCRLFERYLARLGYEVTTVRCGEDAISSAELAVTEGRPYSIALLDLTVPGGLGGRDVVLRLREKMPALIAIAASGYSEDPIMASPEEFGFHAGLAKPFALAELSALLERLIQKRAL